MWLINHRQPWLCTTRTRRTDSSSQSYEAQISGTPHPYPVTLISRIFASGDEIQAPPSVLVEHGEPAPSTPELRQQVRQLNRRALVRLSLLDCGSARACLFSGRAAQTTGQGRRIPYRSKQSVTVSRFELRRRRCSLSVEKGCFLCAKWLVAALVILSAVVLTAATCASHASKRPLCWFK